jgi:hypothetical protein
MFGKRSGSASPPIAVSRVASVSAVNEAPKPTAAQTAPVQTERRSETYFQTKSLIFGALIEAIDLAAAQAGRIRGRHCKCHRADLPARRSTATKFLMVTISCTMSRIGIVVAATNAEGNEMVDLISLVTATRQAIGGHNRIAAVTAHMAKLSGPMATHVEGVRGADSPRRQRWVRQDGLSPSRRCEHRQQGCESERSHWPPALKGTTVRARPMRLSSRWRSVPS